VRVQGKNLSLYSAVKFLVRHRARASAPLAAAGVAAGSAKARSAKLRPWLLGIDHDQLDTGGISSAEPAFV
jgi:hypothetical protein